MGRASILEEDDEADDFDLSRFTPKTGPDKDAMPQEQVRAIAEASNFPSRDPKARRQASSPPEPVQAPPAAAPPHASDTRPKVRRYRTGRNTQFNTRTTPETVAVIYAIADAQGWLLGETIERALAALQRELASAKG